MRAKKPDIHPGDVRTYIGQIAEVIGEPRFNDRFQTWDVDIILREGSTKERVVECKNLKPIPELANAQARIAALEGQISRAREVLVKAVTLDYPENQTVRILDADLRAAITQALASLAPEGGEHG